MVMDRSKWEYKKLGEICILLNGLAFKSEKYVDNGIRVMRITNVQKGRIVDDDPKFYPMASKTEIQRYLLLENDLLVSLTGNVGRVGLLQRDLLPAALNQRVACLRLKGNSTDLKYLFHLMNSDLFENECILNSQGIAQKNMSTKWLSDYVIPIPPIEDQQRIVAELDCLNEMIALKQEQLKEFDKLAQSIFYDMFEDDGDFEKVRLGDVVEVISGLVDPNVEPYRSQLHVSPANIVSGSNEILNCLHAKDEGLISDKYPFKSGMVLYSKIRPNLNKVAVANFDGICSADMYPLKVLPKANNIYIVKLLSSKQFLEYAIKNSGRARMPKLNRVTLFSYTFNLPPLTLQQQFAEKIAAIDAQKELVKQSIAETQKLLDYTMDYYFND